MARVFLSYDRDDARKARALAEALENAGHSVWWDLRIQGGAEFNEEIEQALVDADAVVVLWSKFAIKSAWVRDEAAVGRDSGRLVPVRLDDVDPPLGFRQFQCINLGTWKGRGRPPLDDILCSIDRVAGGDLVGHAMRDGGPKHHSSDRRSQQILSIALLVLFGLAVAAALYWQPWNLRNQAPLVEVVPASPNSAAKSLADDLLVKLGVLQSSHADALQLVEPASGQTPDFIIKVAGKSEGAQANLMLVDNRAETLLWSREFVAPSGRQADLRQQMAYSAARVLQCATQAVSESDQAVKLPTLQLYLSGCANMSDQLAQDPRVAVTIFEKVTKQAPNFKGGWKRLLLAQLQTLRYGFGLDPAVRQKLEESVKQAQRVDPAMGEAFLAQAWLAPPRPVIDVIKLVDKAVAADPNNPDILTFQAIALTNVGRMEDALAATRRAVKADPLFPSARDALITTLLNSDQVDAAKYELEQSEQLWPGATNVLQSRFAVEFRFGDPVEALRIMKSGQLGAAFVSNAAHESYLQAKIEPSARNEELAIANARALYANDPAASWVYARALAEFDRHEELIDFLLRTDARIPYTITWVIFRPSFSSLHKDPRFMKIVKRLGVSDFWRETGKWPDFCRRPDIPYDCKSEVAKFG
jgi:tetratricopeptide (TPR) repeat protein